MNKENVRIAIDVMKRAGKIDMSHWQEHRADSDGPLTTEKEAHACGTAACFGGWLALAPEFQEKGGRVSTYDGRPLFNGEMGSWAVSEFLEIDADLAEHICATSYYDVDISPFYGKLIEDITTQDVIEKLEELLAGQGK